MGVVHTEIATDTVFEIMLTAATVVVAVLSIVTGTERAGSGVAIQVIVPQVLSGTMPTFQSIKSPLIVFVVSEDT